MRSAAEGALRVISLGSSLSVGSEGIDLILGPATTRLLIPETPALIAAGSAAPTITAKIRMSPPPLAFGTGPIPPPQLHGHHER